MENMKYGTYVYTCVYIKIVGELNFKLFLVQGLKTDFNLKFTMKEFVRTKMKKQKRKLVK